MCMHYMAHMLAGFAADRLPVAALSHWRVMTCIHARAHIQQSTPYQTGKGPCNGHTRQDAERRTGDLHRHTNGGSTPTVQRSEHDPISRGAAEHATRPLYDYMPENTLRGPQLTV